MPKFFLICGRNISVLAIYVALGIDLSGRKDILGLWISENEGAKFWLGNFTEMKNRGVKDIFRSFALSKKYVNLEKNSFR